MLPRYHLQFPKTDSLQLSQSEAVFSLVENGERQQYRFHDYEQIYSRPGLYEQMFYDRLQCRSPTKVAELFRATLAHAGESVTELRALDLGAGNGMMGEQLQALGVSRLVGLDIIPEARDAALRDRPGVYDDYYVGDIASEDAQLARELSEWSFNCLTTVAALGFGDIPPRAFANALHRVECGGWVAFNIKETFLDHSEEGGFSRFIRELIFSKYLDLHHLEKYRHRLSIDGEPLFYYALVARKLHEIDEDFIRASGI